MKAFDNPAGKPMRLLPPGPSSAAELDEAMRRELMRTFPGDQHAQAAFMAGVRWAVLRVNEMLDKKGWPKA